MFQITISGDTTAKLKAAALELVEMLGGKTAAAKDAPLSAADKSRLRGEATVVEPKTGKGSKTAAKKDEPKDEAPADDAEGDEGGAEDGDADTGTEDGGEALTQDDVKEILIEAKAATKNAQIISEIVGSFGAKKLSELKPEKYAAAVKMAKDAIAKAKKKSK